MVAKRQTTRLRLALSLSNVNADFLQLILCMFVSHHILDNPFYGAALFLFANIWILFFQSNIGRVINPRNIRGLGWVMWILLALSMMAGQALIFFFPVVVDSATPNLVSFFVILIAARSVITAQVNRAFSQPKLSHRIYKALFQVMFLAPCALYVSWIMGGGTAGWFIFTGFFVTGILSSYQSSTFASFGKYVRRMTGDKMKDITSYQVFSNMMLYSQVAFSLGVLMYICYISFSPQPLSPGIYLIMSVWLIFVLLSSEVFTGLVNRQGRMLSANLFIIGAAMWILGSVNMYGSNGFWYTTVWTLFWGFGLACITSVLNRYNADFKMVAQLADRRVSDRDLYFRSIFTQVMAVIFSYVVMLCLVTVWTFLVPRFTDVELPGIMRRIMIQLPVLFMVISVIFFLRQPLDKRNRQKLLNYSSGTSRNDQTRENLNRHLVAKSRVRFGVKIIAFLVRPFLRLRVVGTENMRQEDFPSIFVCNHGIIYGPVAAVIYLPTYFRPWIDKKMIDRDMATREMYERQSHRIPLLSTRAKMWLARQLSRPVAWALNSFDPVPVDKSSLKGVLATFDATVKVLSEGDNVLIFPERPRRVKKGGKVTVEHETVTVGDLYTGFANIGTLYFRETGKALRFYPIYANRKNRTFRIGEPVVFDPDNNPRDEKLRIAEVLQSRMLALKETK